MLQRSYQKAKAVIKKYGTGYYRATFLFPKRIRHATWTYYRFVREADEIVDNATVNAREVLLSWKKQWEHSAEIPEADALYTDYSAVMKLYSIPPEYTEGFFASMEQDLSVTRYSTYEALEQYMYGSAVVVGYTMSHIIGFQEGALPYAKALGEAFQMTNFLRDIDEDYKSRGRIYLPQEDMQRFGVSEAHIKTGKVDAAWVALMQFEIARTRTLYQKGVSGIKFLHPHGRAAVYAAALIYKEILDTIEKQHYDIFSRRATVSPFRKTMLLWKAVWRKNQYSS